MVRDIASEAFAMDKEREKEKEILNRLRRIEGQIKGLQKMIEGQKDCSEILVQVAAVRAAVNKVGTIIFEAHFNECLKKAVEEGQTEEFIDSLTSLMDKYVK